MLQGLNLSVQGCMNKMLMEKEMVIGGIHTFLKSYADIKITVFSLFSFSAWDGIWEGEKAEFFLLKICTQLKAKVSLKQKFLLKF